MKADAIVAIVQALLEEHKAIDVLTLEVSSLTPLMDYVILASGSSTRHVSALAGYVAEAAKAARHPVLGTEGLDTGDWALVDLSDVVVHVMLPATREHYHLEELWSTSPSRRAPAARRAG